MAQGGPTYWSDGSGSGDFPVGAIVRTIRPGVTHVCSPGGECFCFYDPACNPDVKPVRSAADLIAALDAACLGSEPERSLRKMGNNGIPLHYLASHRSAARGVTTHVAGDLCAMAEVIARFRAEAK